jgi:hypothetical protein
MVSGPAGYEGRLEMHLDSITVTSSLNDIRLLTAESCRVYSIFLPHRASSYLCYVDTGRSSHTADMERGKTVDIRGLNSTAHNLPPSGSCQHDDRSF